MRAKLFFYLLLISFVAVAATGDFQHNGILRDASNNQYVTQGTRIACERNVGATDGQDYCSTAEEWKSSVINTNASGDVTVYNGPALVRIVRVRATTDAGAATTNTAGVILVKNGSAVVDGAVSAKTPGSTIYDGLGGTMFRTSVILNFASASDNPASSGKIEVLYRPLDPRSTY